MGLFLLTLAFLAVPLFAGIITVDPTMHTYKLQQSTASIQLWTSPVTNRIQSTSTAVPAATRSGLSVSCCREELESFQIVIAPTSVGTASVTFANFVGLPNASHLEVAQAQFSPVSTWAQGTYSIIDFTTPLVSGATISLSSSLPTVLFCTVYVPGSTCGKTSYSTSITITPSGQGAISIPVSLYVYDVLLDITPSFTTYGQSQPVFNTTGASSLYNLQQLDAMKEVYLRHRLSARSESWPNGLNYQVSWNQQTKTVIDLNNATSTQQCLWANGCTTMRYNTGRAQTWQSTLVPAWLGNGFPQFEAFTTESGRPDPFNGVACNTAATGFGSEYSGWICSSAYEQEWANYMSQIRSYLNTQGVTDVEKGYYYTLNEPQVWKDYTVAAYLCSKAKQLAPGTKVMISRETHPWIYNHPTFPCSYDITMAHINRWPSARSWKRQASSGETSWIYFLDSDGNCRVPGECNLNIQPFVSAARGCNCFEAIATNSGPHYRAIPWVLWSIRSSGWGYYMDNIIWDNSAMNQAGGWKPARPRVSASLLREGAEDYELLFQANCRRRPKAFEQNPVDQSALGIAYSIGTWNANVEQIQELRNQLALYLEGSRPDMPSLVAVKTFPFGNYFFDFAPDNGTNVPFSFNGTSWFPVAMTQNFDVTVGFGFNGQEMGLKNQFANLRPIYFCQDTGTGDLVTKTVCYNDFNHPLEFHFAVEPGTYQVTFGVGWPGQTRNGDVEYIEVNDVILRNYTCSLGGCTSVREYTQTVTVQSHGTGGALVVTIGSPFQNEYTIISYMKVVGVTRGSSNSASTCARPTPPACSGSSTTAATSTTTAVTTAATTSAATTTAAATTAATTTAATTSSTASTSSGATTAPTAPSSTTSAATTSAATASTSSGATTSATTTSAATTSASTTTITLPCPPPPLSQTPAVPCPRVCCPNVVGRRRLEFRLNQDFATFNCPAAQSALAAALNLPASAFANVCDMRSGSSILLLDMDDASASSALANTATASSSSSANLMSVTDTSTGRLVTAPAPQFPWYIVVGVVLGVIVLVAVVIVVVLVVRRKRQNSSRQSSVADSPYMSLPEANASAFSVTPSFVTRVLLADVQDSGQNILSGRKGQIVQVEDEDWRTRGDWVWGRIGNESGYLPSAFLGTV